MFFYEKGGVSLRLYIRNDEISVIEFLEKYLNHYLKGNVANLVVNGEIFKDVKIKELIIKKKDAETLTNLASDFFVLKIFSFDEKEYKIPISIKSTKVDMGKANFLFQTNDFQTLIEKVSQFRKD